jgi:hypothetical protein
LFSYLPREEAAALCKLAEDEAQPKPQQPKPHPLKPMLAGVLGMGAGTLAGAGAAHLANEGYKKFGPPGNTGIPHSALMYAAPVIGGGLGLAYNLAQAHQMEQLRRASEDPDHKR